MAAWPWVRSGVHPVIAARLAGRALSILGLIATLVAASRLARLGGSPRRAGWWAMLLIAAAPVLAGQPYAVRPDMLGVAFQTVGVFLVLSALEGRRNPSARVIGAYAAFGLAACVKQNLVVGAAISLALLIPGWLRGRVHLRAIAGALALGAGIVTVVYGGEWIITEGRIWDSAYVVAAQVNRVHPGGWDHVGIMLLAVSNDAIGLITLLPAIGLGMVAASRGFGRRVILLGGVGMIGIILVSLGLHSILQKAEVGVIVSLTACLIVATIIPACVLIERSAFLGGRIDAALWLYTAAEFALATLFFYMSTGSWKNYAIQSVVFGAILTARAASRLIETPPPARVLWPIALALATVLVSAFNHVFDADMLMSGERAAVGEIFRIVKQPRAAFVFLDRPGFNRAGGRFDLVYDDWLYPVFESMHRAEPRSGWLSTALRDRQVRGVVSTSPASRIEGTRLDLRSLGFHPDFKCGPFFVWTR